MDLHSPKTNEHLPIVAHVMLHAVCNKYRSYFYDGPATGLLPGADRRGYLHSCSAGRCTELTAGTTAEH